jgi:hypothetical protein
LEAETGSTPPRESKETGTEKLGSNEEAVKPEDVIENRNRNCRRLKQELWKLKRGAHHREKAKKQELLKLKKEDR